MRKLIFSINISIDGFVDHDHPEFKTDAELHDFFSGLLNETDEMIMGRKTYELMEAFWPKAHEFPGVPDYILRFADRINKKYKILFSATRNEVTWENSVINKGSLSEEVKKLKKLPGRNISVGGLNISSQLTKAGLIDEYWFLKHPVILGKGRSLFDNIGGAVNLNLAETKTFSSGVVLMRYTVSQ